MKTQTKKITKATLKSFIKKNKEHLCIMVKSRFDGMTDGVEQVKDIPKLATFKEEFIANTLGVCGVWLVSGSRNSFYHYEDEIFTGIRVSNCCGSFIVGVIN